MSSPEFFVTPGNGERSLKPFHMVQAVRIGNRVEISGQAGFDEDGHFPEALTDEIKMAFNNVERTLRTAGATWSDVFQVTSYHVPTTKQPGLGDHLPTMVAMLRRHLPDQPPLWTCLGVATLGEPEMRVEINVTAHIGK
jgi:enamine deaminase RidA (YjgF/YER057c/UK114 family)